MKYAWRMLLLANVVLLVPGLSAQTAQEVLDRVKKKYDAIADAEMKFSQHVKFEVSKVEQRLSGTLAIKKDRKYRIEVDGRTIVTDGVTVWSHSPQTGQVLIDSYKEDDRILSPEKILAAAPRDYFSSLAGKERIGKTDTRVVKLVPKDQESMVQSMKVWVDEATWLIKKAEVVDVNGKQTIYTVNDIKINTGIPDALFTYQIPDGVEAVDLR
jgi:chaperone LolA